MAQTVKIKSNTTNASAIPASLQAKEIAANILDRSLFIGDGSSVIRLYTGTTKYFDADGFANNALKLGGVAASDYATQTWVTNAYQTKLSLTNKLNASYISGLATVATSGKYSDLTGVPTSLPASDVYSWAKAATKPSYAFSEITSKPTTLIGYGITDFVRSNVTDSINNYTTQAGIYRLSSHANSATPDNAGYGTALTLYAGADTWSQIYASYGLSQNDAGLYWRGATTSNNDIAWRRVLDSANYSSYALPLSGGIIGNGVSGVALTIDRASTNPTTIKFNSNGSLLGYIGFDTSKNPIVNIDSAVYTIYHTGNFNPANYLPKSGGTINGNLLIGTTTDNGYKLDVAGSTNIAGQLSLGSNAQGVLLFRRPSANYIWAYETGGYLLFGCQDKGASSQANASLVLTSTSVYSGFQLTLGLANLRWGTFYGTDANFSGNVIASGTIAMATLSSSDRRLKDNITSLSAIDSLSIIRQLRPTSWNWKKDGSKSYGFVAQEVQPLVKEMVSKYEDNLYLQYNQLHAFEVGAIQHIDNEVETLKRRVNELENELKQYRRTAICQ